MRTDSMARRLLLICMAIIVVAVSNSPSVAGNSKSMSSDEELVFNERIKRLTEIENERFKEEICRRLNYKPMSCPQPVDPTNERARLSVRSSMEINGYQITIFKAPRRTEIMSISRDGQELYSIASRRFSFGHANGNPAQDRLIAPGKNITGGSEPNLVIGDWDGGNHRFYTYRVFSLGNSFKLLATIEANDNERAHFTDLDRDGIPEFEMHDCNLFLIWDNIDNSPAPRVVLRYTPDGYKVAPDLMQKPAPSGKALAAMRKKIRKDWKKGNSAPPALLRIRMVELIYNGYPDLAERLCKDVWPAWGGDRREYLDELYDNLEKSPFYRQLPWRLKERDLKDKSSRLR